MKSKKMLSCVMALSIVASSSIMLGTTAKAATANSSILNTMNMAQTSYRFNAYIDSTGYLQRNIIANDSAAHQYSFTTVFQDARGNVLDSDVSETKSSTIGLRGVIRCPNNWAKATVYFEADNNQVGRKIVTNN